jgi:hypothetical protein
MEEIEFNGLGNNKIFILIFLIIKAHYGTDAVLVVCQQEQNKKPIYSWGAVAENQAKKKKEGDIAIDLLHLCQIKFLDDTEFQTCLCAASTTILVPKEDIIHSVKEKSKSMWAITSTVRKAANYFYWNWPLPFDAPLQAKLGTPFTYPKEEDYDLKFIQKTSGKFY